MTIRRNCLHVIKNALPESAAVCRIAASICRELRPLGWQSSVVLLGPAGPLAVDLEAAGAPVRSVRWNGSRRGICSAGGFWRSVRAESPDVLHVHEGGLAVRTVGRMAGARTIVQHVHSRILENNGSPVSQLRFRGAEAVIATSETVAACIVGRKAEVIWPGVEPAAPPIERNGEPLVLGIASRLIELKGLTFAIDAIAKVRSRGLDVRLEIAGSGPLEPDLRKQAIQTGIAESITFLGWQHQMRQVMDRWHLVLAPSLEEGFGLSVLEAMAMGLPAIATSVGGLTELVIDGTTGILVPPTDSEAIAAAITRMAHDPESRATMARAAWCRAHSQFSIQKMAARLMSLYEGLVSGGDPRRAHGG